MLFQRTLWTSSTLCFSSSSALPASRRVLMDRAKAHTGGSSSSWLLWGDFLPGYPQIYASLLRLSYWLLFPPYFSKNRNLPLAWFDSVLLVSVILITGVTAFRSWQPSWAVTFCLQWEKLTFSACWIFFFAQSHTISKGRPPEFRSQDPQGRELIPVDCPWTLTCILWHIHVHICACACVHAHPHCHPPYINAIHFFKDMWVMNFLLAFCLGLDI